MKSNRILLLAALLASSSANATSLEGVEGDVWVSSGKGFSAVRDSTELVPGDRIRVGRRGLARIIYPDGCSVNVRSNSLATVAKHSPCSFVGQAGGPPQGDPLDATSGNGWIAGAGLVATGGGIAALLATRPSGSSQLFAAPLLPASP
jgi:hypothetical protein